MFCNLLCLWTQYLQEFVVSLRHYDVNSTHSVKKYQYLASLFCDIYPSDEPTEFLACFWKQTVQ